MIIIRCQALHTIADPLYLSRFLFSALPRVAPYCLPGGVKVVSVFRCSPAASVGSGQPKLWPFTAASPRKKVVQKLLGALNLCPGFSSLNAQTRPSRERFAVTVKIFSSVSNSPDTP